MSEDISKNNEVLANPRLEAARRDILGWLEEVGIEVTDYQLTNSGQGFVITCPTYRMPKNIWALDRIAISFMSDQIVFDVVNNESLIIKVDQKK